MSVWYYGFADTNGLDTIREDEETISVELFYDPAIQKQVSDDQKKIWWNFSNRAFKNKELSGVLFRVFIEPEEVKKVWEIQKSNPKEALVHISKNLKELSVCTHGTTRQIAEKNWILITGGVGVPVKDQMAVNS